VLARTPAGWRLSDDVSLLIDLWAGGPATESND
jgi:hypothetical protein